MTVDDLTTARPYVFFRRNLIHFEFVRSDEMVVVLVPLDLYDVSGRDREREREKDV